MKNLKSFSVGHTAKGAIWWQAWPFDGEPRKGTADTIGAALDLIGIAAPTTAEVAAVSREYSDLCAERADDREQVRKALEAKDAEIARLTAIVARMEALLPDPADPAPTPPAAVPQQSPAKGHSSPAKPRKADKPAEGTSEEIAAYVAKARGGVA